MRKIGHTVLFDAPVVIRGERAYEEIWTYIDENPAKWTLDRYYET